jgi:hypothetical protein
MEVDTTSSARKRLFHATTTTNNKSNHTTTTNEEDKSTTTTNSSMSNNSRVVATGNENSSINVIDIEKDLPDVTVKVFLEQMCERICTQIMTRAKAQTNTLATEFELEKKCLLEDVETLRVQQQQQQQQQEPGNNNKKIKSISKTITFTCSQQQQQSMEFVISLIPGKAAKIGRSRGAAFQNGRGISLNWDQEVSTTHGQLQISMSSSPDSDDSTSIITYMDVGSTNGSKLIRKGETIHLEVSTPFPLEIGDVLWLGATKLDIGKIE